MMFSPNSAENSPLNTDDQEKTRNILVIDAMAIAHKINIKNSPEINLGQDFADAWVKEIFFEARGFDEVQVIFDCYLNSSLKCKMGDSRTNGIQIQ